MRQTELSNVKKKSQETKEKIFSGVNKTLGRVDMKNCRSRISGKKQVCRTEVSIIILRQDFFAVLLYRRSAYDGPDLLETPEKSKMYKGRNCPYFI